MCIRVLAVAAFYATLVACGGNKDDTTDEGTVSDPTSDGIDQMYEVSSYTYKEGSCIADGDPYPFAEPYFILRSDVNGGIGYHLCRAIDDCDEVQALDLSFARPVDDHWFTELGDYGCCDEGTCAVFKSSNTLWFEDDDTVRIERVACTFDYGSESSQDACDEKVDTSPTCVADTSGCNERTVILGSLTAASLVAQSGGKIQHPEFRISDPPRV